MAGIYDISKEEILHKVDEMVAVFNLSPGFDTYFIYKFQVIVLGDALSKAGQSSETTH